MNSYTYEVLDDEGYSYIVVVYAETEREALCLLPFSLYDAVLIRVTYP